MSDSKNVLHVACFPWLAFGHIGPFLELAKALAGRGHRITFVSTPRNIQRLPKIPQHVSPRIDFLSLNLPSGHGLPEGAESTMDIPADKMQCLKKAMDELEAPLAAFMERAAPDWIIHDVIAHWVPKLATKFGIPSAFFSIVTPPFIAFAGPPSGLISGKRFENPKELTVPPPWIPFPTTVAFRPHEAVPIFEFIRQDASGVNDLNRMGLTLQGCNIIAIRSCNEVHSDWLSLIEDLNQKPVLPVGLLPPSIPSATADEEYTWVDSDWLDKQAPGSTVYVAFGSEVRLSREQVHDLALGLEQSQLPFIWALRTGPEEPDLLPNGFEDRIKCRGIIRRGWVPQLRILAHPSVGGFLTHAGWSSIIEGLAVGRPLILLPMFLDQGLNACDVGEKKMGLEVPRDENDGSFTADAVAKTLRLVMVEADGDIYRAKAEKMKELFSSHKLQDDYMDAFACYLSDNRRRFLPHSATTEPDIRRMS